VSDAAALRRRRPPDVRVTGLEDLVAEVREVVEGIHGRPARKRGTTIVVSQVICRGGDPCWVAKVKFGSLVIAKCGNAPCGHFSPESALEGLLEHTKLALGVLPQSRAERALSLEEGEQPAPEQLHTRGRRG